MLRFIVRRLLVIFPMVLLVITLTWVLIRLAPGNFYTQAKGLPFGSRRRPSASTPANTGQRTAWTR